VAEERTVEVSDPEGRVGEPVAEVVVASAWSPLRIQIFRALWMAGLVSNVGTFMHTTGASWLMTTLTDSPTSIALLQTVWAAPGFLLALVAGALADILDRRRLLIFTQLFMAVVAGVLGVLELTDNVTVGSLLLLTFLLSVGATLNMPPWVALTPELVPRDTLPQAIALNSISMNIAQSVGPAVAGLVIATLGTGAVFVLNAVSFFAVVVVVVKWRPAPRDTTVPVEHVMSAIRTGVRYIRHSPALIVMLVRLGLVTVFTASLMALLPVIARGRLGVSSGGFGILSAALGLGAVAMAALLPSLRTRLGPDLTMALGGAVYAGGLVVVASSRALPLTCVGLVVAGAGSITQLTTLSALFQGSLPAWVRGRGLAVVMVVIWLSTSVASLGWGALASATSASVALIVAAAALIVVNGVAGLTLRLTGRDGIDVTPQPWVMPELSMEPLPEDGPVMVTVEWRVDPGRVDEFAEAMAPLRRQRRRDGAMTWGLFVDMADPGRVVEGFTVATWAEHERQHGRFTANDAEEQAEARSMLLDGVAPKVTHLISPAAGRQRVPLARDESAEH